MAFSTPVVIFYSYSHKDEAYREKLITHLTSLKRAGMIRDWHDRRILASEDWEKEISENLESADLILLLISSDFIASDYCYEIEAARALEKHTNGEALLIPIILRPVNLQLTPFKKIQALPLNAQPISEWKNDDLAYVDICEGILQLIANFEAEQNEPGIFQDNEPRAANLPENKKITHEKVLEAALPEEVTINRAVTLVAMIRGQGSDGLKRILQLDTRYRINEKDVVATESFPLEFPVNEAGEPQPLELNIKIESPDFEPETQTKSIQISPTGDSVPRIFLLTPKKSGDLVVTLELFNGKSFITNCLLNTKAIERTIEFGKPNLVTVKLDSNISGEPNPENKQNQINYTTLGKPEILPNEEKERSQVFNLFITGGGGLVTGITAVLISTGLLAYDRFSGQIPVSTPGSSFSFVSVIGILALVGAIILIGFSVLKMFRSRKKMAESSEYRKMFYHVLLEEYESLRLLNAAELEEIQAVKKKIKEKLGLLNEQEIQEKFDTQKKRDAENQRQLALRTTYRLAVLSEIRQRIHEKDDHEKPTALCFSGGGIRSATFGLGVLQGLAKRGLIDKFDYLSTVSGGGYIGSWLSAWIFQTRGKTTETGAQTVDFSTEYTRTVQIKLAHSSAENVEPIEVSHLRAYSNYMSPRAGLFSTDTWTLVGVYLRNLLLNWTVFVPLLAAILLLPRLFLSIVNLGYNGEYLFLLWAVVTFAGMVCVSNIIAMRPTLGRFSWIKQNYRIDDIGELLSTESKVLTWCFIPLLILAIGITLYWSWFPKGAVFYPLTEYLPSALSFINIRLLHFMVFGDVLFVGGFLTARTIIWFRGQKFKTEGLWENVFKEFLISIFCGAFGGTLLYIFSSNLSTVGAPVRSFLETDVNTLYVCFGVPLFLTTFLLSATIFVGIASKINDDMDREWMTRFGALVLIAIFGWTVVTCVVFFGPIIFKFNWVQQILTAVGGISGFITLVLGFSKKSSVSKEDAPKSKSSFLLWFAPQVAAPIFAVFLMLLIVLGTNALMGYVGRNMLDWMKPETPFVPWIWFALFAAVGSLMGWWININKFSLHSTYRERLIRAYLGASRTKERLQTANSFTGLDSLDNIEMKDLRQRPLHVVNMTLNLVKTSNLRWQNRKAESFTATALHCGSSTMGDGSGGYRKSDVYAHNDQSNKSMTLGTAAAISGAAASPNMGYYTMSTAVSFLMTLFNVRLGWWLGNPGKRGENTYRLAAPRWSPRLFFSEALGGTDDTHPYIYLSDGGHFDNLGLYEMVLRRCHLIVVCDAGADSEFGFSDFGTAIHKIRVDLGVPIVFRREKAPIQGRNCGVARIKYSEVDGTNVEDGFLIYIKPTLDGDEPIDIVNYKKVNPDFPHESTADQMFSETQFESYRSLGFHMINSICDAGSTDQCDTVGGLKVCADKYLEKIKVKSKK
jgi:hypothetical protein